MGNNQLSNYINQRISKLKEFLEISYSDETVTKNEREKIGFAIQELQCIKEIL